MVFDPRTVEHKHRCKAWVIAVLFGVFLFGYLGAGVAKIIRNSNRNEPPVTVSVSSHWGTYPNIWVCHGKHEGQTESKQTFALGAQFSYFASETHEKISVATNTEVFPVEKYRNIAGVPFERSQNCSVAKFSTIPDDEAKIMRLYMQVRAINFTTRDSVFVFAEAIQDSKTQRDESSLIRLFKPGAEGFTKQNCALTKTRFGVRHLLSKSFGSRFTCPSVGSEPPRKGKENVDIALYLDKSTVMVFEEAGLDYALVKFLVPIGSILGLLTAAAALCFVPVDAEKHKMTLRGQFEALEEDLEEDESEKE